MHISELIAHVGDDNVKYQPLDSCIINASFNHRSGTKITFGTDQRLQPDGTVDLGIVIWLPREAVQAAIAAEKGGAA